MIDLKKFLCHQNLCHVVKIKKIAKQNILLKNTSKDTKEKWAIEIDEESHPYYENDETR